MAMDLVREQQVRRWTHAGHTWRDQTGKGMKHDQYKPLPGPVVCFSIYGGGNQKWQRPEFLTPTGGWDADLNKAKLFTTAAAAAKHAAVDTRKRYYMTFAAALRIMRTRPTEGFDNQNAAMSLGD